MAHGLVSPVFVGRETELSLIGAALESAIAGDPAIVIVGGEAGVGKTRLVEEVALRARGAGAEVLEGGCVAHGGAGIVLGPVLDGLRPLIRSLDPDALDVLLGPARVELSRLMPELEPAGGLEPASASGQVNARLLELLLGVVERLAAERPLMVVVEDLHWGDRSTVDFVGLLVRALRGVGVLCVVTFRSDDGERGHPLRTAVVDWERARSVRRVDLGRFSLAETAGQLEAILGQPPDGSLLQSVYERSEGNAFFSEEVLGAARGGAGFDGVPRSLREMLLVRAERLSEDALGVLRVAAVAGRSVPDGLLSTVSELDDRSLEVALREAVEQHLLVADHALPGYRFRHALTRDAVYEDVLPRERVRLHQAYAEALTADPALASSEASLAAALALHWSAARELPRALAASVRAGRLMAAYAPAEALAHFERGLELWARVPDAAALCGIDHVEALTLTGTSADHAGQWERALELYDKALADLDGSDDVERVAHLLRLKAGTLADSELDQAVELLERAVSMLPPEQPSVARAMTLGALAFKRFLQGGDPASYAPAAEEALAAAVAAGTREQEARARMWLGLARAEIGDEEGGIEELRRAAQLAEEIGTITLTLASWANLTDLLERAGRHRDAADAARHGLAYSARAGCTRETNNGYVAANGAEALIRLGSWPEVDTLLNDAIDSWAPRPRILMLLLTPRATVAALTGQWDRATEDIEGAVAAGACDDVEMALAVEFVRSLVVWARGEPERARALIREALEGGRELQDGRYSLPLVWLGLRIEAEAHDPSPQAVRWLRTLAAGLPCRTQPARTYHALVDAEGHRAAGDGPGDWAAALEAARAEEDPYLQAYALLRGAEQALAAGEKEAAAPMLRESAGLCDQLGAEPLLAEVRACARGGRVRIGDVDRSASAGFGLVEPYGLTERELEVFRLVAVGRSNKQIAAELVISPKTASIHVSNLIGKLDVSNRTEAAALAHRIGITPEGPA